MESNKSVVNGNLFILCGSVRVKDVSPLANKDKAKIVAIGYIVVSSRNFTRKCAIQKLFDSCRIFL